MKFSRSIQFNAVPDWSSHYIAYSNLKKLIYALEKSGHPHETTSTPDAEESLLIGNHAVDVQQTFKRALDHELQKICNFYARKEGEIYEEASAVRSDLETFRHERDSDSTRSDSLYLPGSQEYGNTSRRDGSTGIFKSLAFGRPRRSSTLSSSYAIRRDGDDLDAMDDVVPLARARTSLDQSPARDAEIRSSIDDLRASRDTIGSIGRSRTIAEDYSERSFPALFESTVILKKRIISVYVSLCELKSFVQLNRTGFAKALKKFDKLLDRDFRPVYMQDSVGPARPFRKETMDVLDEELTEIEKTYAEVSTKGDVRQARSELRLHLREYVVWERNTVWREMIGMERKADAARLGRRPTILTGPYDQSQVQRQGDETPPSVTRELDTPLGKVRFPQWAFGHNSLLLLGILACFIILLSVPILQKAEQQNCLAMLVLVSLLWATEVIPLFVTSLLVPFLVVILRIERSDQKPHSRLDPRAATSYIFSSMWSSVIMLLLGGFTIAAALSKYQIARVLATFVLGRAGVQPRAVLLTNMLVAMVASMFISNVAAPVLSYSIIQPILRKLSPDAEFAKSLILGIALSACIGGMASPIASPQNIIALEHMRPEPSWLTWFFVVIPVCLISVLSIWMLLLATFRVEKGMTIMPLRPARERFTSVHWFISMVSIGTIVLWCVTHQINGVVGDMGVVAILPMVLFFGTGILTKEDFNNFLWTIIILAAGGLALGKAVDSSGLLHTVAHAITAKVEGMSVYIVFVIFSALILVVASFISHTVAALIFLPLVREVGMNMNEPHPNLLVMGGALMCSAAMALPTSGFPNMTAIMMEDPRTGQRYLHVKHFISRGVPGSLLTFLVVISVGYGLMFAVGF